MDFVMHTPAHMRKTDRGVGIADSEKYPINKGSVYTYDKTEYAISLMPLVMISV